MWDAIASLAGSALGFGSSMLDRSDYRKAARDNINYQKEFAQKGISWRVEDAKSAGLHPLAALGAQVTPYQPTYNSRPERFDFQAAGQDLGRAIRAGMTKEQRRLYNEELREKALRGDILSLQKMGLQFDLEERFNKPLPSVNKFDPMGITETDIGPYETQPHAVSDMVGTRAGVGPMGEWRAYRDGTIAHIPDSDVMDWVSESIPAAFQWWTKEMKYSAAMIVGQITNNKYYQQQKEYMERRTGKKVYFDVSEMMWRLQEYEPGWQVPVKKLAKWHYNNVESFYEYLEKKLSFLDK